MMATGTMIGTGITPTLITATSLFLPTAFGGDFTHGITILTTLTDPIPRITTAIRTATMTIRYDSYDYNTQNPYSYYNGYAAPAQSGNAVVSSVQSQLAKLGYTTARSTELLETKPRPLSPVIKRTMT